MLLGYARFSTEDQNLDRQIDQLKDLGISMDNIYTEKVTGTKRVTGSFFRCKEENHM